MGVLEDSNEVALAQTLAVASEELAGQTGLYFTQFADYGLGWEEFDEASAYDPQLDIAYGWDNDGIGTRPDGGSYQLGITGFAFLESPVDRTDGLDNDEDGVTDEDRFSGPGILITGRDAIRAHVEATYNMTDFERFGGPLEDRRAFKAGRWWTGDEDLDWVGYEDSNGNGTFDSGELVNDDYGRDGIGPYDLGYPGPDEGEADGMPQIPEPNFDETDLDEGDQIALLRHQVDLAIRRAHQAAAHRSGLDLPVARVFRHGRPPSDRAPHQRQARPAVKVRLPPRGPFGEEGCQTQDLR